MMQPPNAEPAAAAPPEAAAAHDDHALFAAAQAGDFGAFTAVVHKYHARVYRLVFGMTKNNTDSEEVVQETFLNVFRHLGSFRRDSSPSAWVYRIAVNAALMRLRQRRRKPLLALEDHGAVQGDPQAEVPFWSAGAWARQPEEQLASAELGTKLHASIDGLPEKYRLVLLLRDVEGHTNEEVAESLGLTVPTVKARLHRARLYVRKELEIYFRDK